MWCGEKRAPLPGSDVRLLFLPAEVGRARGRRVCGGRAGCLWARERYAMSALRLFHNIEGYKLKTEKGSGLNRARAL